MDNTATGGIKLSGNKTGKEYTVYFKNCISKPKVVNISSGEIYDTFNVVKLPDEKGMGRGLYQKKGRQ